MNGHGIIGLAGLLEGIVVEYPSRFPGLAKVLECTEEKWKQLLQRPGTTIIAGLRKNDDNGCYLPYGLLQAGVKPGPLNDWPPEPYATTPSGLTLDEHQLRAVSFLRAIDPLDGGAILGGDIGTGKTICALHALWLDGFLQEGGVVCGPLGSRDTWCSEEGDPQQHYGLTITPIVGTDPDPALIQPGRWYFVHFDIAEYWTGLLFNQRPKALIVDESHNLCNSRSRRHKAVLGVAKGASLARRILLTGTPIPKGRMDLEGELEIAQPNQWDWERFGVFHAGGHRELHSEDRAHWVFDGRTNTEELRARLAGVYLRYTKESVASSMPKLVRHRVDIELDAEWKNRYHLALTDIRKYTEERQGKQLPSTISIGGVTYTLPKEKPIAAGLVVTSALKSILDHGKLPHARRIIDGLLPFHDRILVGTWRRESAVELTKQLKEELSDPDVAIFGPLTGQHSLEKRIATAIEFAECEDAAILVVTRGAVKESINRLSVCDAVLQITPDWNPDSNLQFEGRVHRKGNLHSEVHSYYMLAPRTLDDRVLELLAQKGEEAKHIDASDVAGWNLAVDLDPTGFEGEQWSLDEICALVSEIKEL